MVDMDVDQVMEVPDTPDRLISQNSNGRYCIRREGHLSSEVSPIGNADFPDDEVKGGLRNKNKLLTKRENRSVFVRENRRIFIPPQNGSNKSELQGNMRKISSGTAFSSRIAYFSNSNAVDDTLNHGGKISIQPEYLGKGQAISNSHSQMPASQGHGSVIDLPGHDGHSKVCQRLVAGSSQAKQNGRKVSDESFSPILIAEDSNIGKKIVYTGTSDQNSCQKRLVIKDDFGTSMDSLAEDKDSHRVKGKGLVTHNILAEESDEKTRPLAGRNLAGKVDDTIPANKDACERSERTSGWISTHECTRKLNPPLSDKEYLLCHRTEDPCNADKLPRNVVVRRENKDEDNARKHSISSRNVLVEPIIQTVTQKHQCDRSNEHHGSSDIVVKRQRQGSYRSHHGESSSSAIGNSDLVVLGSSHGFNQIIDIVEFSPETRSRDSYHIDLSSSSESDVSARPMEADELQEQPCNELNVAADCEQGKLQHASSRTSSSASNLHRQNLSRSSAHASTPRVTQARVPTSTRMIRQRDRLPGQPRTISSRQSDSPVPPIMDGMTSSSASNLHRQNLSRSSAHASTPRVTQARVPTSTRITRPRGRLPGQPRTMSSRQSDSPVPLIMDGMTSSSASNLHRQNLSRSSAHASTPRVTQARVPTSTRMIRPRGRLPGQPRTISSRQSDSPVPPIMDGMRMLFAIGRAGGFIQSERHFNEVLLALHNNGQHGGASAAQIHGSPGSTIQSSSFRSYLRDQNLSRSSSTQRVTEARVRTSTRRLRGRFPARFPTPTISSRQRNSLVPTNFNGMRIHLDIGMASGFLQSQRDSNEVSNYYDSNRQHGGATAAQIDSLPESTVQTDNLEECSICLETPSTGDTVRYLHCLHRFHKDCIDEWLRRRKSCPICKFSIT